MKSNKPMPCPYLITNEFERWKMFGKSRNAGSPPLAIQPIQKPQARPRAKSLHPYSNRVQPIYMPAITSTELRRPSHMMELRPRIQLKSVNAIADNRIRLQSTPTAASESMEIVYENVSQSAKTTMLMKTPKSGKTSKVMERVSFCELSQGTSSQGPPSEASSMEIIYDSIQEKNNFMNQTLPLKRVKFGTMAKATLEKLKPNIPVETQKKSREMAKMKRNVPEKMITRSAIKKQTKSVRTNTRADRSKANNSRSDQNQAKSVKMKDAQKCVKPVSATKPTPKSNWANTPKAMEESLKSSNAVHKKSNSGKSTKVADMLKSAEANKLVQNVLQRRSKSVVLMRETPKTSKLVAKIAPAKPSFQFLRLENKRQSLCFGNASLQMIWVAETVRKLIQAYRGDDKTMKEVSKIFNSSSGKASLSELRALLPDHLHKGHQDAMEFLQYAILDPPYPELKALFQYSVNATTRCSRCKRKHHTVVNDSILICGITEESVSNGKWNFRAAINDLNKEIKVEHWNCNRKECRGRDIECRKVEKYDMTSTKYFLVQLKVEVTKKKVRIEDLHLDDMQMFGFHWRVLSTIEHVGSRNSGHYTAFVRHPTEPGWLRLDDAKSPERWRLDPELKNHYLFLFEKIETSRIVGRNSEEDKKMLNTFSNVETNFLADQNVQNGSENFVEQNENKNECRNQSADSILLDILVRQLKSITEETQQKQIPLQELVCNLKLK